MCRSDENIKQSRILGPEIVTKHLLFAPQGLLPGIRSQARPRAPCFGATEQALCRGTLRRKSPPLAARSGRTGRSDRKIGPKWSDRSDRLAGPRIGPRTGAVWGAKPGGSGPRRNRGILPSFSAARDPKPKNPTLVTGQK
jgi:hypothetical protein